jgi:hypothetical protein
MLLACIDTLGINSKRPRTLRLAHTRVLGARQAFKTSSVARCRGQPLWRARIDRCQTKQPQSTPSVREAPPASMGLGDLLLYAFCAFIVGVFIFNLVDTAQTAKRKIAAKKHD